MNYRKISSFDNAERLPALRKNKEMEDLFQLVNQHLLPIQKNLENNSSYPPNIVLILISTPRSGSTLLSQILTTRLNLAYPSNLMARFYEVPAVGALLQKELLTDSRKYPRSFKSVHGVTERIDEPHEFGYFWARHLGVCKSDVHEPNRDELNSVNIDILRKELNSISNVLEEPIIFKCPLACFFIPVLQQIPNVFFIDLRRNLLDSAKSICRVRLERLGSFDKWWSIRPQNYFELKELNTAQQIIGQINAVRNSIERDLLNVEDNRKMIINYEKLIENPEAIVDQLMQKLQTLGRDVDKIGDVIKPLKKPTITEIPEKILSEFIVAFKE